MRRSTRKALHEREEALLPVQPQEKSWPHALACRRGAQIKLRKERLHPLKTSCQHWKLWSSLLLIHHVRTFFVAVFLISGFQVTVR